MCTRHSVSNTHTSHDMLASLSPYILHKVAFVPNLQQPWPKNNWCQTRLRYCAPS